MSTTGGIETLNILNAVAFAVNLLFIVLSQTEVIGTNNTNLSEKYQTLLTPNGAFTIWPVIFLWQTIFTIAQLTPWYRSKPIVAKIAPWWIGVNVFQSLWSIIFGLDSTLWGQVIICLELICLYCVILMADTIVCTWPEYFLLRFGFSIHTGWVTCATALGFSVLADSEKAEPSTLLAIAIFLLAVLAGVSVLMSTYVPRPDPGIPFVVAWAAYWISDTLKDPKLLLSKTRHNPFEWSSEVTDGVSSAAIMLCLSTSVLGFLALILRMLRTQALPSKTQSESLVEA